MEKNENKFRTYKRREFEIKPLSYMFEIPVRAKRGSIGYDLTVPEDIYIPAHSRIGIPLKFAINLPYGTEAKIEPRSGFSLRGIEGYGTKRVKRFLFGFIPVKQKKTGKFRFNADVLVGKIDPNYTDEVNVIVKNDDEGFEIKAGTRIAQMTFYNVCSPFFVLVDKLSCKSRGGGLGSSGTGKISLRRKKNKDQEESQTTIEELNEPLVDEEIEEIEDITG